MMKFIAVAACVLFFQGCIHKIVTVPVKVAYKTTKYTIKGTAAVIGAVIPDGDDDEEKKDKNKD